MRQGMHEQKHQNQTKTLRAQYRVAASPRHRITDRVNPPSTRELGPEPFQTRHWQGRLVSRQRPEVDQSTSKFDPLSAFQNELAAQLTH
ncbi:hypothetical protein N7541_006353 [Penicillium brevicompactum]|uniref:Uncharacterized protein n=1 Tax=Penicillium brevicompactum TaxID=5074 RepID=A0A9W9R6Z9_PENBR|nr:hypothetical protein N7541_006353 [Penicillium brevicompactum]